MNELKKTYITAVEAFDRSYKKSPKRLFPNKTITCFNCGNTIGKIQLSDDSETGRCPNCGVVLFDWSKS